MREAGRALHCRAIARTPRSSPTDLAQAPPRGRSRSAAAVIAAIAFSSLTCATGCVEAATNPIYKCVGADRGLIYTDQPCKGGEVVDIRPGNVDAAAVERLKIARDMLDRSAAARLADQRRHEEEKTFAAMASRLRDDERTAADADYNAALSPDSYGWWYPGSGNGHRPRFPHRVAPPRPVAHGFAPHPPFVVPRS
jgi:hypothetical protein